MLQKIIAVVAMVCLCGFQQIRAHSRTSRTEREDISQAENAILASLAVETSPRGASLCVEKPVACVGPERLELAMSLIAARNTPGSLRALASLVRYKLDGAYAEDYDALVIQKGTAIQPFLVALSPKRLHETCKKEFAQLMGSSASALGEVREEYVCRTEESIASDVRLTLDAIRHHRQPE